MTGARLPVILRGRAATQIEEASAWWREHREGSPNALVEEVERAFELISQQPGVGVPATNTRLTGVRRLLLPRVGYLLYYRLAPRLQQLQVLALWHARRSTGPPL